MPCWRVFPWDPGAADGARFSARYIPPAGTQTGGRFDLGTPALLYLAETPAHAVAELIHRLRGGELRSDQLLRGDPDRPGTYHTLSLVSTVLPDEIEARLPDFADPAVLLELGTRPDHLASHDRGLTRSIARRVHAAAAGYTGFRWWSALTGDWHVTVLFLDRVDPAGIEYSTPEPLHLAHPAVQEAARFLRIRLPGA